MQPLLIEGKKRIQPLGVRLVSTWSYNTKIVFFFIVFLLLSRVTLIGQHGLNETVVHIFISCSRGYEKCINGHRRYIVNPFAARHEYGFPVKTKK